jgi:4-O-beta-D-mannosyl-D-glucose phosphorylase
VWYIFGWAARADGTVFIYYASSDTRCHDPTSTVARLVDYALHTPGDGLHSAANVAQRPALIRRNLERR